MDSKQNLANMYRKHTACMCVSHLNVHYELFSIQFANLIRSVLIPHIVEESCSCLAFGPRKEKKSESVIRICVVPFQCTIVFQAIANVMPSHSNAVLTVANMIYFAIKIMLMPRHFHKETSICSMYRFSVIFYQRETPGKLYYIQQRTEFDSIITKFTFVIQC